MEVTNIDIQMEVMNQQDLMFGCVYNFSSWNLETKLCEDGVRGVFGDFWV